MLAGVLLCSLERIARDASHATARDDIDIAKELPLFAVLLDPKIPQFPAFRRNRVGKGWPKGKPRNSKRGTHAD